MPMPQTECTYALRALAALEAHGWQVAAVDNGGNELLKITGPTPVMRHLTAIVAIEAVEQGAVIMHHPVKGSATLCLLFQNGEPEEVIYDTRASSEDALDAVEDALATILPRDWAR